MTEMLTIEDVKEHVDILSGAGFADGAFFERSGRTQNSKLAGSQIAASGAAIANAYRAQAERIAALEAMLKRLEWASNRYQFDYETITICPVCHATEFMNSRGHRDGCELAALLPEEAL